MPSLPERIRELIRSVPYDHNDRLPPERKLAEELGVSRSQLRRGLAELEADGVIWRHVGRGTFVGARPVLHLGDMSFLKSLVSPTQVVAVRMIIEPETAKLAAQSRTASDIDRIRDCAQRCRAAADWRGYEAWDNNLHHAIAQATRNKLLIYLFETLNVVRRSMVWGQPRKTQRPAVDYQSFGEHDAILAAIAGSDANQAQIAMRQHLDSVYSRVLPTLSN
jgi:DNA-binding FadR family transcriptional regulator